MPVLTFKVSADEARRIRHLARAQKTTVSAYLRTLALPSVVAELDLRPHPVSGCLYNAAARSRVTATQIKAALVDFP